MRRRFLQVDVFGEHPYEGNPLAVVIDAEGLTAAEMQAFANWTNLSETTFLLSPTHAEADYRVRIFTPTEELPFAGHPTLGSASAWLTIQNHMQTGADLVQECAVGLVEIRHRENVFSFKAPPLMRSGAADEHVVAEAAEALAIHRSSIIRAEWVDNGPGWLGLLLQSADEVLALKSPTTRLSLGVAGAYPSGSPFAYEVRAFYSSNGITMEDPVTGSLNASLAQWMIASGRCSAPYQVCQGRAVGRNGVVSIDVDEGGDVWVGGNVAVCVSGEVDL
ncbi:MAG: PhzF family phenazine biosynthesis protein [Ilumatobacteraceae bacterium]|nr:PhzF family phenazine biosynthesis protein [Ilumatobacteraceae bacterium]